MGTVIKTKKKTAWKVTHERQLEQMKNYTMDTLYILFRVKYSSFFFYIRACQHATGLDAKYA